MRVHKGLSREFGELVLAADRECFRNCLHVMTRFDLDDAIYVEGYAIQHGVPIVGLHGWIEHRGHIIDPTPCWHARGTKAEYFGVLRLDKEQLCVRVGRAKQLPFSPTNDLRDPAYKESYRQANLALFGASVASLLSSVDTFMETGT